MSDTREDYVEKCLDPSKRNLDRNRGIQANGFAEALKRAADDSPTDEPEEGDSSDHCPENFE